MKAREDRRKVLVNARMRHGSNWNDVRIVDISTKGLCLHSSLTPPRGPTSKFVAVASKSSRASSGLMMEGSEYSLRVGFPSKLS